MRASQSWSEMGISLAWPESLKDDIYPDNPLIVVLKTAVTSKIQAITVE